MRYSSAFALAVALVAADGFAAFVPQLPVFAENALSASLKAEVREKTPARLAEYGHILESQWGRVKREMPPDAFQYVRTEKRMEMARRIIPLAEKELARGNTDGLAYAFLYTEDLKRFCRLFDDELTYWRSYPLAPGVKPRVIRVTDYGARGDGKTDNKPAFDAAIAAAAACGGRPVVIDVPEGEFHFSPSTNHAHVLLKDLTNVVLRGVSPEKTRLRFDDMEKSGVTIWGGANVTVKGMELAMTETPFFQGVVESFDKNEGWAIVRHHPGTMRPDDPRFLKGTKYQFCLGILDREGNEVIEGWMGMFYDRRAEDLGDGRFKVHLMRDHYNYKRELTRLEPGWQIVIPCRKAFCACIETVSMAYMCNVSDVWVRNGRGGGVGFCSEARYSSAWRVRVFPFPGLLASSCADGIMNHRGTFIGECEFDHLNDDGANCYSGGRRIKSIRNGDTIVGDWLPCVYAAGDPMQVMSARTGQFLYLGRVKRAGGAERGRGALHDTQFEDMLPSGIRAEDSFAGPQATAEERFRQNVADAAVNVGREPDQLYRPYMFGVGHVVYKCRFSSLRGSGAVLICPNALLEDVTYEHMVRGVSLTMLGGCQEGPPPYNVIVRNCLFRHCNVGIEGRCMRPIGGNSLTAPIRGLEIRGCRFEDVGKKFVDNNVADDAVVQADLRDEPLVVFRLTSSPLVKPEFFKATCAVHAKYRGAFDEFWYGGGKPLCKIDVCRADLKRFAAFRPQIEAAGMRLSFQQGLTTGHDYVYVGDPGECAAAGVYAEEEAEPFPDDAWMVRANGEKAKGRCLCPRAPSVLDYESRYVKTVLEELRPDAYWLDDDLRLGVGSKVGCFCQRCVSDFGAEVGTSFTREKLVSRLFDGEELDPLRQEWIKFNERALERYGKVVRAAADEVLPSCRLSLQTVSADCLLNGRDYGPILRALSADGRVPAGIRPGHGYYKDDNPMGFLEKSLWCTREAERCRQLGRICGTVCYEEETYGRLVLHKSPRAIVTECALALASGCDTLSLYWADGETDERIEDYERFVKVVAEARPYFERLSASTRRTSLGGVARYLGSRAYEQKGFTLSDQGDLALCRYGIPVTVAEATASNKVWLVTARSRAAMSDAELEAVRKVGCLEIDLDGYPSVAMRTKWLDKIDALTGGRFPVRIDAPHVLRVLPRIDKGGKTDSVSVLNLSIGDTDELKVRIRNPAGPNVIAMTVRGGSFHPQCQYDAAHDELTVSVPNVAGWQIVTLFLSKEPVGRPSCTASAVSNGKAKR